MLSISMHVYSRSGVINDRPVAARGIATKSVLKPLGGH